MNNPVQAHEQTNTFAIMVSRSDLQPSHISPKRHEQIAYLIQAGPDFKHSVCIHPTASTLLQLGPILQLTDMKW